MISSLFKTDQRRKAHRYQVMSAVMPMVSSSKCRRVSVSMMGGICWLRWIEDKIFKREILYLLIEALKRLPTIDTAL